MRQCCSQWQQCGCELATALAVGIAEKLVISLYVCVDVDVAVDVDLDVRLCVYRCISAQTDIILNTSIHYTHAYSRMGEKDARCAVPRGGLDGSRHRATGSIS